MLYCMMQDNPNCNKSADRTERGSSDNPDFETHPELEKIKRSMQSNDKPK